MACDFTFYLYFCGLMVIINANHISLYRNFIK